MSVAKIGRGICPGAMMGCVLCVVYCELDGTKVSEQRGFFCPLAAWVPLILCREHGDLL